MENVSWRNEQVPWIVGVFEKGLENPEELTFLRIGLIVSSTLVFVAGYLNFTLPMDRYLIAAGIKNLNTVLFDELHNFPNTFTTGVQSIHYEDPNKDPDKYRVAVFRVKTTFVFKIETVKPILVDSLKTPGFGGDIEYLSAQFLSNQSNGFSIMVAGFSNDTGDFRYYQSGRDHAIKTDRMEITNLEDPCFNIWNLFAIQMDYLGPGWNLAMLGLIRPEVENLKKPINEDGILFDLPSCPVDFQNLTNFAIVMPTRKYKLFIEDVLSKNVSKSPQNKNLVEFRQE